MVFFWVGVDGVTLFWLDVGGGGHFSGWVWVSVVFFWVGVGGVTLFWLDVGECGIRDSPDDY